jgi:8-oxo-dGTP pyrophosphatase MutT (NUDIX family)
VKTTILILSLVISDGRVRRRDMKGISEKRFPTEKINDAAIRAMQEELGLPVGFYTLKNNGQCNQQSVSPSYPGLVTHYQVFKFKAFISEAGYKPEGYVETKHDRITYFRWK